MWGRAVLPRRHLRAFAWDRLILKILSIPPKKLFRVVRGPGGRGASRWPCASTEVSNFAYIGWKLETSGNENGNFIVSNITKCIFTGKSEGGRKLGKLGERKLRGLFGAFEVSIWN